MNRSLRVAWGSLLVVVPGELLRMLGVERTPSVVFAARVLGARHLLEAALMGAEHKRRAAPWMRTADGLHALTMFGVAIRSPRLRRAALASAASATSLLVSGARGR